MYTIEAVDIDWDVQAVEVMQFQEFSVPVNDNKHFEEFSEAAQVMYLSNNNNTRIICYFEFEISEFGKETTNNDFHFQIPYIRSSPGRERGPWKGNLNS